MSKSQINCSRNKTQKRLYNIDIKSLLWLPANVYWLNTECKVLGFNSHTASLFNLPPQDCIGLDYDEMTMMAKWKEGQGYSFQRDDIEVMSTKQPKIGRIEPLLPHPDGRMSQYITTRSPLLNQDGKVVGVFGISIETANAHYFQQSSLANNLKFNFTAIDKLAAKHNLSNQPS